MVRMIRLYILMVLLVTGLAVPPAMAKLYLEGSQSDGAIYRIYVPDNWNGDLVVFAHGYVNPYPLRPPEIPEDQLKVSGKYIPDIITGMGYAFAVTSYSKNGLAVVQGVTGVLGLAGNRFIKLVGTPKHTYLVGVSEGGLVTALALEQHPEVFSGGGSLCGPIGDFQRQINYLGDFRVIFDYFFPNSLPPSPISIPPSVMTNWGSQYEPIIAQEIGGNTTATNQLLNVTRAPTDSSDSATREETALGILWYNIFATNDGKTTLGGQPFGNRNRVYTGSEDNIALNFGVKRFNADQTALTEIQARYQTSGKLNRPLISMHTIGDPIVPYWHEALYLSKVISRGSLLNFITIPINRYGHVNFTESELLAGFALLVKRVTGQELLTAAQSVLNDPKSLEEFLQLGKQIGAFR